MMMVGTAIETFFFIFEINKYTSKMLLVTIFLIKLFAHINIFNYIFPYDTWHTTSTVRISIVKRFNDVIAVLSYDNLMVSLSSNESSPKFTNHDMNKGNISYEYSHWCIICKIPFSDHHTFKNLTIYWVDTIWNLLGHIQTHSNTYAW